MEILKINKLLTTSTNTFFNLSVKINDNYKNITFIGNNEQSKSFDKNKKGNYNCLCVELNENNYQLIHNMYSVEDCFFKSSIYKLKKSEQKNNIFDFQNIITYKLSNDFLNLVKIDNTIYSLTTKSRYGKYETNNQDIYSYLSCNNFYTIPKCNLLSTVIYDKNEIINTLSNDNIDETKIVSCVFDDIEYNLIYEIPGNIYNDFQSGCLLGNAYKTKNQYSSTYDMQHNDNIKLKNAREYTSIGVCGKQLFLKYQDNINYSNINYNRSDNLLDKLTYEKVEIVNSINRLKNYNGHSTNLYSILIKTDLLNNINDDNYVQYLIQEIQSNIRSIVKNIIPAQAQLLSVIVQKN